MRFRRERERGGGIQTFTHFGPPGGTPLQEANGDVPLDEVAFSRLE